MMIYLRSHCEGRLEVASVRRDVVLPNPFGLAVAQLAANPKRINYGSPTLKGLGDSTSELDDKASLGASVVG